MKTAARILFCLCLTVLLGFGSLVLYVRYGLSDHYTLTEGETLRLLRGSLIGQKVQEEEEEDARMEEEEEEALMKAIDSRKLENKTQGY